MTDVVSYAPPASRAEIDSWVDVIRPVVRLAEHIADTDMVPKGLRGNPAAITAVILHGRELGIGPMTALSLTSVVEGKPTLSAEGQRSLVLAAGHDIEFTELSDAVVTVRGRRTGEQVWTVVTWTLDRARHAGLAGKANWRTYPRAMLAARASAELCRLKFGDVLHGLGATEEYDGDAAPANGTAVPTASATRVVQRAPAPTPPPIPAPPVDAPERHTAPAGVPDPPKPEPEVVAPPASVTPAQLRMLGVLWHRFDVTDGERRSMTADIVGRDLEGTTKNLSKDEASNVINVLTDTLTLVGNGDPNAASIDPVDAVTALTDAIAAEHVDMD